MARIHEKLVYMTRICANRTYVAGEPSREGHRTRHDAMQDPLHLLDQRVRIEHTWHEHLAPAEGKELAGECGGAVGGAADLLEVAAVRRRGWKFEQDEIAIAADHGEHVVEVVRDATGETADRLHLLRLNELPLELLALSDVDEGIPPESRIGALANEATVTHA